MSYSLPSLTLYLVNIIPHLYHIIPLVNIIPHLYHVLLFT